MIKNKIKLLLVGVVVILACLLFLYSFIFHKKAPETVIKISGAWALYPLMEKWTQEYHKIHPEILIDLSAGGAGKGMRDALAGAVDIGMVSREIFPEEIEKGMFWVSVTKDAVVPIVNEKNPFLDELLTKGVKKQTLENIWIKNEIKTWGDIVGTDSNDVIAVYTRNDECGAAEMWAKYLGKKQKDLLGIKVDSDPGIRGAVVKDVLGIGYVNMGYGYVTETGKPARVKIVPIDINENGKIDPEEDFYKTKEELVQAIAANIYPSPPARELNLVATNKFTGATKDFVKWILTDGQQYVIGAGYVPLPAEKLKTNWESVTSY